MSDLERLYRRPRRNYEPDYPPIWSSPSLPAPAPQTPPPRPRSPQPMREPKEITPAQQSALDEAVAALENGHLSDDAKRVLASFVKRPELRMSPTKLARDTQLGMDQIGNALAELVADGHLRMVGALGRARTPAFRIWR